MKLAVIGVGNAGSKITDTLLEYEYETNRNVCRSAVVVNSARVDLARVEHVPEENRKLLGQTDVRSKGHGVGGDPDLGAEIIEKDHYELERALDGIPVYDIDAFLLIAGMGGGTGSGGAQVIGSTLQELFEEPVYGLAVLPSTAEGGRATLNAARTLPSFGDATDNLLLFDNDEWRQSDVSMEDTYQRTNREIAKRVITLMAAGEIDGSQISENAMDASDIRRTLATGGVSVIGYHEAPLEPENRPRGLLERFRRTEVDQSTADAATKVNGVIRQAVRSRLTCDAEIDSTERSLAIVSGPPAEFSRKGLESGRRWLEDVTGSVEVMAGDDPRADATHLSCVVLLSNVTDVPRITALQERAAAAHTNIDEQALEREREPDAVLTSDYDELEPV